ncbi:MAG: RDD family protein [Deltaproteobacteria bacterium]|nr:RDD family protein [Deltaproteobacteria bacterium]
MNVTKSYEILRLKPDASVEELKLAYRDLVNVWHPDRFLHNPRLKEKAERQLQEINEAYEIALQHISSDAAAGLTDEIGVTEKHPQGRPNPRSARKPSRSLPSMPGWLVRFLARSVDGIIFALMLGYVEAFRLFQHPVAGWPVYIFAGTLLWAFVEANLLSSIGTTPGKWLLGIRVVTHEGNKPVLLEAFKRSIGVWWYGLGAGCVPLMPLMMAVNGVRLMKKRPTPWDRKGHFVVNLGPRRNLKTCVSLAIVVLGCFLLILLWGEQQQKVPDDSKHPMRASPPQSQMSDETVTPDTPLPHADSPVLPFPQPASDPGKPDNLTKLNNAYFEFVRRQFLACASTEICRPEHDEALMRQTLLSDYGLCGGRCDDLDSLPEGLRFIGLSGTVQRLKLIFRAIDDGNGLEFEGRVLGHYNPTEVNKARNRVADLIQEISRKQYQAEEPKLLAFINDYKRLSEDLYRQRPAMIQRMMTEKKRRHQEEASRQTRNQQQLELRRKLIQSGALPIATLNDARWYYQPDDGMPMIYNPPLLPLTPDLQQPYYMVGGDIDGMDQDKGIYYRVVVKNPDKTFYFKFRIGEKVEARQFRVGQHVSVVGKLIDIFPYVTKGQDVRYMPVFDACFIE